MPSTDVTVTNFPPATPPISTQIETAQRIHGTTMSTPDQTINLPQLLLILILGGLAVRYFFFSSTSTLPRGGSSSSRAAREADVERVQQMFPQIPRRDIMWDLQRNGGNMVATTERILSGRGLEVPPQSFQPLPPPSSSSSTTPSTNASSSTASSTSKTSQPDLITRYNLQSRLSSETPIKDDLPSASITTSSSTSKSKSKSWSTNKSERQALLEKRRNEMILSARRKMEEKIAAEGVQG